MPAGHKRKLLVILGAGSSTPCGMASVAQIDAEMKKWSYEWKAEPGFPNGIGRGIFNDLWEIVEEYYRGNVRSHLGLRLNFERVLGEITALASWVTPSPFGNALRSAIRDGALAQAITWPRGREEPYFYRQLILAQSSSLLSKLADYIRDRSLALDTSSPAFVSYKTFFSRLCEEFSVGIYTLNYDDIALRAWPESFTGFSNGKFDPRSVSLRSQWDFIYHLHGSIHYSFCDLPGTLEWKNDLRENFKNCESAFVDMASEFKAIVPATLIAGGYKLDQILADPSQTFHAALIKHAHEADSVLIIGYGFGDVHVNRALQNRFDLSRYQPRERPPVVVIDKSDPLNGSMSIRQGHDFWAWQLTHTLNTRFQLGSPPSNTGPTVKPLIENKEFELDMVGRTAIWHAGFTQASEVVDQIIGRLKH